MILEDGEAELKCSSVNISVNASEGRLYLYHKHMLSFPEYDALSLTDFKDAPETTMVHLAHFLSHQAGIRYLRAGDMNMIDFNINVWEMILPRVSQRLLLTRFTISDRGMKL